MNTAVPARSVGVVVTFAHRDPLSVLNLMRTLAAQTRLPEAMALVNFGTPCPELEAAALPFHYVYRHFPQGVEWCLPLAENQGVRLLPPVETLLFIDADTLLAPNFIECGLRLLDRRVLINCRLLDLPRGAVTPETDVVRDFERLKSLTQPRLEISAVGGCQWVRTKAFAAIRGHDEGFKMWCFEDMDFQRRARWLGLQPVHLEEQTALLHQWHLSKDEILKDPKAPSVKLARDWYRKNLARLQTRVVMWDIGKFSFAEVNPQGWGKLPKPPASPVSPAMASGRD
jgi:hypothetical protein